MRPSFGLRLSARLARDRRKWGAAAVVGVAALVVTTAYLVLQSLVVSPGQALDRDLGRYGASIGFGTPAIKPGTDGLATLSDGLRSAGFTNFFASLSVMGVHLDGVRVDVREGDWSQKPYPRRYLLQEGEWADQPGEVTVAMRDPERAPAIGARVSLLSARMDLTVVGVADCPFAGDTTIYLIGSGTWASVPPTTARAFPDVEALPVVLWDGTRVGEMVDTFAAAHPQRAPVRRSLVRQSMFGAADVVDDSRDDAADRGNPYAYAIPSLSLPALAVVLWLGLLWRKLLGNRRQLIDVGVPPRAAAGVTLGATFPSLALALLAGVGVGTAVAAVTRPLVETWHKEPLSPLVWPWDPLLRCGVVAMAGVVAAFAGLWWWRTGSVSARRRTRRGRPRTGRLIREIRRWVAVLGFLGIVAALPFASSVTASMLLAAASVLLGAALAPDALAAATRILPNNDFRLRLGGRQLRSSGPASAGVSVIAATVGCSIAFTILLSTMIATMDSRQTPDVLPGQVIIYSPDGGMHAPSSPEALQTLRSLHLEDRAEAVQLRFLSPEDHDKRHVVVANDEEYVMAVDSVDQAAALLGDAWEDRFGSVLRAGGLVRWLNRAEGETAAPGDATVVFTLEGRRRPLAELKALSVDWPRVDWARGVAGMILTSTARSHDLPLSEGELILTSAPDSLAPEIQAALRDAGLDEQLVAGYQKPPPPIPPTGLAATAVLLAVTALLMITISAAGRVAELRPTLGVLLANGVPPRWIRQCVLYQEAMILLVGLGVGVLSGVLPVLASVPRFEGYWVISLPGSQIAALLTACVLGTAAAALLSARALRPGLHGSPEA